MNITYVLLSPTFGMHQYTADLANRAAQWTGARGQEADNLADSQTVRLITTATAPRDRYSAAVQIHAPITTHGTGFSREGLNLAAYRRVMVALSPEASSAQPGRTVREHRTSNIEHRTSSIEHRTSNIEHRTSNIVHFTGVHAWNVPLVHALRRRGIPVIHTLHDLDPHTGVRFGGLIRLWNRLIIASGCHLLVHGRHYRDQLIAQGVPAGRVTVTPLLHGFLSAAQPWPPVEAEAKAEAEVKAEVESLNLNLDLNLNLNLNLDLTVLFFGRVEAYKGVDTLLAAWRALAGVRPCGAFSDSGGGFSTTKPPPRLILAGPAAPGVTLGPLPAGVALRDRRIMDDEADALFRSAGVLVLPYRDATQSALVAAAYAYGVPVIVTETGALPEYVVEGETGWVVPPGDPAALAAALRAALSDPARLARMGAAGRAWFAAQRRAEAATLAEMYGKVAAARSF